jgi:hypothetical protein
MNSNLLSSLNPRDDIHEFDYSQHLKDAGFGVENKPTIEDVIWAMPPAEPTEERISFLQILQLIGLVFLLIAFIVVLIFIVFFVLEVFITLVCLGCILGFVFGALSS